MPQQPKSESLIYLQYHPRRRSPQPRGTRERSICRRRRHRSTSLADAACSHRVLLILHYLPVESCWEEEASNRNLKFAECSIGRVVILGVCGLFCVGTVTFQSFPKFVYEGHHNLCLILRHKHGLALLNSRRSIEAVMGAVTLGVAFRSQQPAGLWLLAQHWQARVRHQTVGGS